MSDAATPKRVIIYKNPDEVAPFKAWLNNLQDKVTRQRIIARISRMQQGNYGDWKPVGEGVNELRMFFGSGYRVYFGERNDDLVVLLCGGDKSSQGEDIAQAKAYWKEYLNNEKLSDNWSI
ncbi:MAG: type II toxin-antitoxin system RelE/ParE family toxin [Thermosynechococcaceae cyanobacterium]